jgi:hypothetical protein
MFLPSPSVHQLMFLLLVLLFRNPESAICWCSSLPVSSQTNQGGNGFGAPLSSSERWIFFTEMLGAMVALAAQICSGVYHLRHSQNKICDLGILKLDPPCLGWVFDLRLNAKIKPMATQIPNSVLISLSQSLVGCKQRHQSWNWFENQATILWYRIIRERKKYHWIFPGANQLRKLPSASHPPKPPPPWIIYNYHH